MCRAQGYVTAATKAGVYEDVYAILKGKNNKAILNGLWTIPPMYAVSVLLLKMHRA